MIEDWASRSQQWAEWIHKKKIPHHFWNIALNEAFTALTAAQPGEVVCITGPSRCGKSRLAVELIRLLCGPYKMREELQNRGLMPVLHLLATNASTQGAFATKSFIYSALQAIKHPLYSVDPKNGDGAMMKGMDRTTEAQLHIALRNGLIQRGVKYIFVDEMQHVLYARGNKNTPAAIMNSMKCLAEETGTILVMIGAYPILDAIRQAPHMVGRKHQVHLPRYRQTFEEIQWFDGILEAFSEIIPLEPGVESLRDWNEELYTDSLGCIGLLGKRLRRAVTCMEIDKDTVLRKKHINATRSSASDINSIAREIQDGEKELESLNGTERAAYEEDDKSTKKRPASNISSPKPFRKKPDRYRAGDRS